MSSSRSEAADGEVALQVRADGGEAPTSGRPAGRRKALLVIAVVVGVVAAWQLATIRPGHQWGDDFAMYIMEARNIASLHSYTDTDFIYNPARPTYAPRAYPPGYPLVLAPVYRVFGLSFTPMKVEIILLFVGGLFLLGLLVLDELPLPYVAVLLALIGFAPKFTQFKNNVLSDIPGMFFVVLVLLMAKRERDWGRAVGSPVLYGALLGMAMYMAFATRALGVVVVAAVVAGEIFTERRLSGSVVVGVSVFVVLAAAQTLLLGSTLSYFDALHPTVKLVVRNIRLYPVSLADLWLRGGSRLLAGIILWATGALALLGFVVRAKRRGMDQVALFAVLYPVPVVIWPAFTGLRYLIPWIPFFVFFMVVGAAWIGERLRARSLAALPLSVVATVLFTSFAWGLAHSSYGPYRGIDAPAAVATFAFIRTHTPASAVLLVDEPRAFALFTGRRSSSLSPDYRTPPSTSLAYAESIHATYMVIGQWHRVPYRHLFSAYSDRFRLVFKKGPFTVMELLSGG